MTIKKRVIGLCLVMITLLACTKSSEDTDELDEEKGYATGKTDSKGNAISESRILLDNTVLYASYIHSSTDKNGIYKIKVQPGSWRTFAYVDKTYNGQKYTMELCPDKTDSYSDEGAVRNFTWQLEGAMPWEAGGYYGGTVILTHDIGFYEDDEDIELT